MPCNVLPNDTQGVVIYSFPKQKNAMRHVYNAFALGHVSDIGVWTPVVRPQAFPSLAVAHSGALAPGKYYVVRGRSHAPGACVDGDGRTLIGMCLYSVESILQPILTQIFRCIWIRVPMTDWHKHTGHRDGPETQGNTGRIAYVFQDFGEGEIRQGFWWPFCVKPRAPHLSVRAFALRQMMSTRRQSVILKRSRR